MEKIYQSAAEGEAERRTGRKTVYLGFVMRRPIQEVESQATEDEFLSALDAAIDSAPSVTVDGWEKVVAGPIELTEVYSIEKSDHESRVPMLVLVRIPYQKPQDTQALH